MYHFSKHEHEHKRGITAGGQPQHKHTGKAYMYEHQNIAFCCCSDLY